jgi:phosphate transport system substrate-binding protein
MLAFQPYRSRAKLAIATMTLVIVVAVVVVALAVGVAFITVNHNKSSSTSTTAGFAGYPSSLPSLTINVEGSSLMYIIFLAWLRNFTHVYSNVPLNVDGGGSGLGQQDIEESLVQIGTSDAYLFNQTQLQYPWILDIPLAVSAQQINYNVPQIPSSIHLNFSGPVLAGIYNGSIQYWNDPQIVAINPGAANLLPHQMITPLHRADGSGDTFIFTSYLSKTDPWWNKNIGNGLTVNWPALESAEAASGNSGMELDVQSYNYSIGYIGISYLASAEELHLGYGYLQNAAGNFVNISATNIQADLSAFTSQVPNDERISMIDGPGANAYPIVNFEYALVSKNQTNPNVAEDLKTFLKWAADPNNGNSPYYLDFANFQPLPPSVYQLTLNQINEIGS